jgi:hypothetical protein
MHTNVDTLFDNLWQSYTSVTPSAAEIHKLLGDTQKADVLNDHIALRTFNIEKVNLDKLAAHFLAVGYKEGGEYHFKAKKLYAKHFEHSDPTKPKVFISELLVEEFSEQLQKTIHALVDQIDEASVIADNFLYSGTHWQIDSSTYHALLEESEYAAWTAAWGYRANHFTVNINHLANFETIEEVNKTLKDSGFELNTSGGEIKGSPEVLLEQSSTLADKSAVQFSDGEQAIPSCFYEFARRYAMPDGELYTGFVAASADKIFESTNVR